MTAGRSSGFVERGVRKVMGKSGKGTTAPGYTNRNNQTVVRCTDQPGTDHGQVVYELRCGSCGKAHGANGSDIFQRRCPHCDPRSTGEDLLAPATGAGRQSSRSRPRLRVG